MKFEILNPNLYPVARDIIKYFKKKNYKKIYCEKPLNQDAQIRPTLIFRKLASIIVVEIKDSLVLQDYFEDFVKDCLIRRERVEIYFAFPHSINGNEISYPHGFLDKIGNYGIGILVVQDKNVLEVRKAVICNMRITEADIANSGKYRKDIMPIITKFNNGDFVDAIRDITELFEEVISYLALSAARSGKLALTIKKVKRLDLEGQINLLSAPNYNNRRQKQYFDTNLSLDLKSFKGARNLSHHPRNKIQQRKLEDECFERMHTGIRLIRVVSK